jgi:hypothetical protein
MLFGLIHKVSTTPANIINTETLGLFVYAVEYFMRIKLSRCIITMIVDVLLGLERPLDNRSKRSSASWYSSSTLETFE